MQPINKVKLPEKTSPAKRCRMQLLPTPANAHQARNVYDMRLLQELSKHLHQK